MAIRPNGFVNAPEAPKSKREAENTTEGGSPKGWTFISTSYQCWRKWLYQYVLNFWPSGGTRDFIDPRRLGSAYHGLLEGKSKEDLLKRYPAEMETALALYHERITKGPPLPTADVVEEMSEIFGGKMTSKPDRIETVAGVKVIRDYKTAAKFSDYDHISWMLDGGIIGEMVAAGTTRAIVDIQRKWVSKEDSDGKNAPKNTKLVEVHLTERTRAALEQMVEEFWDEVDRRLALTKKNGADAFPRRLTGCVGKYGPCQYVARCWGEPPEALLFRQMGDGVFPGLKDRAEAVLKARAAITKKGKEIP
jgi:hypothetical protein